MAGTTNFVQHNPNAANQEPDGTFDSDSLTTAGIGVDAVMPSSWMNKRWYQDSTFVAAFAQMLAAKGYSTSDANVSTLAGVLANVLTNADIKTAMVNVTWSASVTCDCSTANGFRISLAGNTTITFTNSVDFQVVTLSLLNPSNYTVAFSSNVRASFVPYSSAANNDFNFTQQFISFAGKLYPFETELLNLQSGKQDALGFTPTQQGGGTSQLANKIYIGWDGTRLRAQVDTTDLGQIAFGNIPTSLANAVNTPANALNTTYQNTTGRMLFVSVNVATSGGNVGTLSASIGIASPSQVVAVNDYTATLSNGNANITFMVPPNWYYSVSSTGSAFSGSGGAIRSWVETGFGLS